MKRYAILMVLAAMLCGTEAGAATIGFDSLVPGTVLSFPPYIENEFKVSGTGANWSGVTDGTNSSISAGPSGGHVVVERPTLLVLGDPSENGSKARDHFEIQEFRVQSLDVASYGNFNTTFTIQGLHGGNPPDFFFQFNFTPGPTQSNTFLTISLTDLSNPSDAPFFPNMRLSEIVVQQLVITGIHGSNVTSYGVDNFNLVTTGTTGSALPSALPSTNQTCTGNGCAVPEPASMLLLGAGLAGIGIWRRKARR